MGDWTDIVAYIPGLNPSLSDDRVFEKSAKLKHINSFNIEEQKLLAQKEREFNQMLRTEMKCSICINLFVRPVTLECGHT